MESKYLPDPEQFRPLTPLTYVLFGLLFLVPVVGLICAILLAFLAKNINLRLFARGCLIWYAMAVVAVSIFAVVLYSRGKLYAFLRAIPKAFRLLFP